ncbi:two-component system phosphate regulon response regulator PhoB [Natronocella acetinitrilica]|uniref:Phosphate regulon transcriptional regulatory protein PhoB n=1 Tax=Natronocella acetinitrilica TaxID=414046 RepID=A0AAE3KHT2_9GAMM|nr:phosphate regulon transcriptional regulator PhoB [Natronocella acetinitrilica]MCP1676672.1 two-component system phosphate regulon response regulator PhoB [Natronocella acetinitrilica]
MAVKILIIEDEAAIREMVEMALGAAGYEVFQAETGEEGFSTLNEHVPDLILLDWMLPGMSGIDFAKRIKKDPLCSNIPIIMLTARGEEEDKVRGLDVGADDFVTKPFSPRELVSRIKAVLRRASPMSSDEVVEVNGLRLDPVSHRVSANEEKVDMGPTEFRLLHFFMTHPERVFTRGQLLDNVWGTNVYVEERTVDVHIRRLRKSIADTGHDSLIQTVRGAGYRFSGKL